MTLEVSGGIVGKSSGPDNFDAMPTVAGDPIVESGSNSDGEWTRWANGTQQCIRLDNFNNYTVTTEPTSTGSARLVNESFPFPLAFIAAPATSITFHSFWSANIDSSTSSFTNWVNVRLQTVISGASSVTSANNGDFVLFASGRYK